MAVHEDESRLKARRKGREAERWAVYVCRKCERVISGAGRIRVQAAASTTNNQAKCCLPGP